MKTFKLICIATLLFTLSANAQITKGNWMVGGTGSFSSSKTVSNNGQDYKSVEKTIRISPSIGYFFVDKLATGLKLGYEGVFIPDYGFGDINTNTYNIGPFVRYYFLKSDKIVNLFAEGSFGFGKSHQNATSISTDLTKNNRTYSLMAGPVVYFNSSVSLELSLQYSSTNIRFDESDLSKKSFQVAVGFQIYLIKDR